MAGAAVPEETMEAWLRKGYQGETMIHLLDRFQSRNITPHELQTMPRADRGKLWKELAVTMEDRVLLSGALTNPTSAVKAQARSGAADDTGVSYYGARLPGGGQGWSGQWSPAASTYDDRVETGHVGLVNQGATCYLNSLLQTLFHLSIFRASTYKIPTEDCLDPKDSIPLALQKVFYNLEFKEKAGTTEELTASFGWRQHDSYVQHDVQELLRKLLDNLENKMKGTPAEGSIEQMFVGEMMNYIECPEADYTSSRSEQYYDLQLAVKGCRDVYASFDEYTAVETLDGLNKYAVERDGNTTFHPAKKGVWFKRFPPILVLHLRRFEYDYTSDRMQKVNDRYEFPDELDLGRYLVPNDSALFTRTNSVDQPDECQYQLHSVLVHSGGSWGGHYYAFVRPNNEPHWFKFNDEHVYKSTADQAIANNFGYLGNASAYMLVYVQKRLAPELCYKVPDDQKPQHLKDRFERDMQQEVEEQQRREQELNEIEFRVWTDDHIREYVQNCPLDMWDPKNTDGAFRLAKTDTIGVLKEEVATKINIPVKNIRLWGIADYSRTRLKREACMDGETTRPLRSVGCIHASYYTLTRCPIYVETLSADADVSRFDYRRRVLIFLKFYTPETQDVRFLGSITINIEDTPQSLSAHINGLVDAEEDRPLTCIKEAEGFGPTVLRQDLPFRDNRVDCGDTLCFQLPPAEGDTNPYPLYTNFILYLKNRRQVRFIKHEDATEYWKAVKSTTEPKPEPPVTHLMSLLMTDKFGHLQQSLAKAAGETKVEHIRFWGHNTHTCVPRPEAEKSRTGNGAERTLQETLLGYQQASEEIILYWDMLEMPIAVYETKWVMPIEFFSPTVQCVAVHQVMIDRNATIKELAEEYARVHSVAVEKMKLEREAAEGTEKKEGEEEPPLPPDRLFECDSSQVHLVKLHSCKIYERFKDHVKLPTCYAHYSTLRLEEEPRKRLDPAGEVVAEQRMFQVIQFHWDAAHYPGGSKRAEAHNDPFYLWVTPTDTGDDLRRMVCEKLQIQEEEATWPLFLLRDDRSKELDASTVVLKEYSTISRSPYHVETFIGIQNANKGKKKVHSYYYYHRETELHIKG